MTQIRVAEPIASPFDDERALIAFLADLAEEQAETFASEFAERCGHCGMLYHPACAMCAGRAA